MTQPMRPYGPDDLPWLQNRIACPAPWPHYVIPGSHVYDPFYWQQIPPFPFPRAPWPYESETRAPGTGLLPAPPCVPNPSIMTQANRVTVPSPPAPPMPSWAATALRR